MVEVFKSEIDVRDAATKLYKNGEFDAGDTLLSEQSGNISDYVKLECLGNRFFYKGELQDAIRCFEEGITLNPQHQVSRYQYLVGTQLEKQNNFVDAFKRYQAAIEIAPDFIDPYVDLGGLLVKVEDFDGALRCYQDAFNLDRNDPRNAYNLKAVLEKLVAAGNANLQPQLDEMQELCECMDIPADSFKW